jgi:hypothetical protein
MRVREAFFSNLLDPVADLLARVLGKEPVQIGAIPILQGAFKDQRRRALQVKGEQIVFLKERCERGWYRQPFEISRLLFFPSHILPPVS